MKTINNEPTQTNNNKASGRLVLLLAIVVIAFAGVTTMAVYTWQKSAGPVVVLPDGGNFDFGVIEEGQSLIHKFKIRNDGQEMLVLGKLLKNCACIDTKITRKEVPPGEETEVIVGYQASSDMKAAVSVQTNDPANPWLQLTVSGVVRWKLQCYPNAVTFWGSKIEPQEIRLVVTKPGTGWKAVSSKTWLLAKVVEQGDNLICEVQLSFDCPGGNWSETITVTTTIGEDVATLIIPVHLRGVRSASQDKS